MLAAWHIALHGLWHSLTFQAFITGTCLPSELVVSRVKFLLKSKVPISPRTKTRQQFSNLRKATSCDSEGSTGMEGSNKACANAP